MHANKFERDVQGKLDGMRMTPSDPVWAAVEARIRQERKKRRILFFWLFFPLLLLIGGGALWLRPQDGANTKAVAKGGANAPDGSYHGHALNTRTTGNDTSPNTSSPEDSAARTMRSAGTKDRPRAHSYEGSASDHVLRINDMAHTMTAEERAQWGKKLVARIFQKKAARRQINSSANAGNTTTSKDSDLASSNTGSEPAAALPGNSVTLATHPKNTSSPSSLPAVNDADSGQKKAVATMNPLKDSAQVAAAKPVSPQAHKKRLQWALEGGGGAAFFARTGGMQSVSSASYGDSSTHWSGGSTFAIGGRLILPTQGRVRLVIGLNLGLWNLLSETETSTLVSNSGAPFGGVGVAYYSSTKTQSIRHLVSLQLPLALQWQPAPRLPLTVSGGFTVAQLLSAVPGNVERTQFSLQAGARYRLARVGRHSIELGPQLGLGLRHFAGNRRLVQAGATLRFSF